MSDERRRRTDTCLIFRVWERIAPYWHIGTSIFIAFVAMVWWVKDVSGYDGRISGIDIRVVAIEQKVNDIAIVKQRVDDIANFMGVPRKQRGQ